MKSFKTEEEKKNDRQNFFNVKHTRSVIESFLSTMINSLIRNGFNKDSAIDYIKDIAESLRQEKIFTEDNNGKA